jgi:hypothetical protein
VNQEQDGAFDEKKQVLWRLISPAILDWVLSLDGDGGQDVLDIVHVRLAHAIGELARVRNEGSTYRRWPSA